MLMIPENTAKARGCRRSGWMKWAERIEELLHDDMDAGSVVGSCFFFGNDLH